jgi:hypothetical protein
MAMPEIAYPRKMPGRTAGFHHNFAGRDWKSEISNLK